jgi:glycosyltransferase involved in cell wall biosynthesis
MTTIAIPTLNRKDLLRECLDDLYRNDFTGHLLLIDNGGQNLHDLEILQGKACTVQENQENLGVAGSWNQIGRMVFDDRKEEEVIILNDDIAMGVHWPDLQNRYEGVGTLGLIRSPFFWSAFRWTVSLRREVGLFDEKFFPAYREDSDYERRCELAGVAVYRDPAFDPQVKRMESSGKNAEAIGPSTQRYLEKWGGLPGHETFTTPFGGMVTLG